MNALELASMIDLESSSIPFDVDDVSSMLRRQHEAIVKLRQAIRIVIDYSAPPTLAAVEDWVRLRQALKDTEEFQ